jgi:hypothetical protein
LIQSKAPKTRSPLEPGSVFILWTDGLPALISAIDPIPKQDQDNHPSETLGL